MKTVSALILLLAPHVAWSLAPAKSPSPHCGTARLMRDLNDAGTFPGSRRAESSIAESVPARTLETAHFLIRYSLRGIHQVKTVAGDRALMLKVDSLFAAFPVGYPEAKADSAVYRQLDAARASHPAYVMAMATYFEQAWDKYVSTLKMKTPRSESPSHFYGAPPTGGKYTVDVADIGTAVPPYFDDEIYALTYPARDGGMLVENDFLFRARLETDGRVSGDSIQSRYQGRVIHNYVNDWEMGLKVTCFHEFYHSVQFTYVPMARTFHVWYETGAVGMEERHAPEVDDYLQYLPSLFEDLPVLGMFQFEGRLSQYGNGIFHLFLTWLLAEDFDTRIWSRLAENGDNLRDAFSRTFASYGKTPKEVFTRYASQLGLSGNDFARPFPVFSPDLPLWPTLKMDSLDFQAISGFAVSSQPPFSLRAFQIRGAQGSGQTLFLKDQGQAAVLLRVGPDSSQASFPTGMQVTLDFPDRQGIKNLAILANGSLENIARAEIKQQVSQVDSVVLAYPNPLNPSGGHGFVLFTRTTQSPATVRIFGEAGKGVRELSFAPDKLLWAWDLIDNDGFKAPPGVYYYRAENGPLRTLYLR